MERSAAGTSETVGGRRAPAADGESGWRGNTRRPVLAGVAVLLAVAIVVATAAPRHETRFVAAAAPPAVLATATDGTTTAATATAANGMPVTPALWEGLAVAAAGGAGWAVGEFIVTKLLSLLRSTASEDPGLSQDAVNDLIAQYEFGAA